MKIIVVGCGRLGADLAYRLYKQGHEVVVIDHLAAAFRNLSSEFSGRTIEGDVLNREVLHRAGIEKADALAAVTNTDTINVVVARIAKVVYGLTNVVVRNYEPHFSDLLEAFGVQFVSSTIWGAKRMEELINHADVRAVFSTGNGEVEVYELVVPKAWGGHPIIELEIKDESMVISVTRAGKAVLPSDGMRMSDCDVVNISATSKGIAALRQRLATAMEA